MPLSRNEIKSRALAFSRTWADVANEDSEAKPFWMAFLFALYQRYTSLLPAQVPKTKRRNGSAPAK